MVSPWKPSENRGFYYGSSKDTRWNNDQAWRAFVSKQNLQDTLIRHQQDEQERAREMGTSRINTMTRTAGGLRTSSSGTVGLQSVQGLVRALSDEQEQRMLKEKALQELLLQEVVQRSRAEHDLRKLERKVNHLVDRLAAPSMPAAIRGSVNAVRASHKRSGKVLAMKDMRPSQS